MKVVWDKTLPVPDKDTFLGKGKKGGKKTTVAGSSKTVVSLVRGKKTRVVETNSEEEHAESEDEIDQEVSAEKTKEETEESGDNRTMSVPREQQDVAGSELPLDSDADKSISAHSRRVELTSAPENKPQTRANLTSNPASLLTPYQDPHSSPHAPPSTL